MRLLDLRFRGSNLITLGGLIRLSPIILLLLSSCSGTPVSTQPTSQALPIKQPIATHAGVSNATSSAIPAGTRAPTPDSSTAAWKSLPILPSISDELKAIYHLGLEAGNDPHAFSILGDCQSLPDEFMGVYDRDPSVVAALPDHLQETVRNFSGSFNRYSPTVKDGTTTGALLWAEWNDNEEGLCEFGETPLVCELRVHRPSIVLIHIGTHWETRNYRYLTIIVEAIIAHGAVPVLTIKADNRELDERVNQDYVDLAEEFDLPIWNFWAAVQHLPADGLYPDSTWELNAEAQEIHRRSALEALDAIWRAVGG